MRISFLVMTVGLLGCAMPIDAQIVPPARAKPAAVADPAMVFEDRGQSLELYPALRAAPAVAAGKPGVAHQLFKTGEAAPMGPSHLGVVFNHALQRQGYLTGEIAFKPRGDGVPADLDAASWPGLAKLTNPNIYIVVAATPKEFLQLFNRLKARGDLEWVEAVVIYGAIVHQAPQDRPARPDTKGSR
jgi:hypothetical protein